MSEEKDLHLLVRCIDCTHFGHYGPRGLEPMPESLGQCKKEPWDGFKTQWPFLRHPCKAFEEKAL